MKKYEANKKTSELMVNPRGETVNSSRKKAEISTRRAAVSIYMERKSTREAARAQVKAGLSAFTSCILFKNRSINLAPSILHDVGTHEHTAAIFPTINTAHTSRRRPPCLRHFSRNWSKVTDEAAGLRQHPAIKIICLPVFLAK